MDTYDLKELTYEDTPDFVYEYQDSFFIKNTLFKHIGYGLYMVSADSCKHLYEDDIKIYPNLIFVLEREKSEVLFAYSVRYSTWNFDTLYTCLTRHLDIFTLDDEAMKMISHISIKEERDFYERLYAWPEEPEKSNTFDTPYKIPENGDENYIYLQDRVGTKIAQGIYQFQDPLKYRKRYSECRITPCFSYAGLKETALNMDCTALYEENWSWGSLSFLESVSIHYIMFGELTEQQRNFIDLTGLSFKQLHKQEPKAKEHSKPAEILPFDDLFLNDLQRMIEQDKAREQEYEEKFLAYNCREVFQGKGFQGDWDVEYNKLFEFQKRPHSKHGTWCGFTEEGVCLFQRDEATILPYKLLRYLRISLKQNDEQGEKYSKREPQRIGHTFIENSDALEIELLGEKGVEFLKRI